MRTRLKSFADSRGTSSVAEGAGLGRLKGEQQHKLPLSDTAIVALGEVKTHGLVFEGAFELICICGV